MGIFTMPKPPFASPELPYTSPDIPFASSSRRPSAMNERRRSSFFPTFGAGRPSVTDHVPQSPGPRGSTTTFQTSFLGRRMSQALVPAFVRNSSLASAARDRNPSHLRMGETHDDDGDHGLGDAFYRGQLSLDEVDSEDEKWAVQNKIAQLRQERQMSMAQGNPAQRGGWKTSLGWDSAPPKGKKGRRDRMSDSEAGSQKKRRSRKHRSKRAMREMDAELDAYNVYAQNGLTVLTRTKTPSSIGNLPNLSSSSLPSAIGNSRNFSLTSGIAETDVSSIFPDDRSMGVPVGDGFDALDIMADHIFRIGVQRKKWFKAPRMGMKRDVVATGVTIRAKAGLYRTYPVDYEPLDDFEDAITRLNPEVAIKINSQIVRNIMRTYMCVIGSCLGFSIQADHLSDPSPSMSELILDANTRIQILETIPSLARARKHQYAAFVRSEGVLVVWADIVENIVPAAEALEDALMDFIWRGEDENKKINRVILVDEAEKAEDDETGSVKAETEVDPEDLEMRKFRKHWRERPTRLIAPMFDGMAIIVCMCILALGLRTLISEYILDGQAWRFGLAAFLPLLATVAAFACLCLVTSVWQTIGPIRQCTQNSLYYSGIAPKRTMGELSHVTIQMPVYKESLDEVIRPTVESLKRAITTYERQGGSVGIIICDDGLQLLPFAEAEARRRFYFDNNIAFVARPGHGVDGFVRKGRFKKAGNLNFANALSLRIEILMDELRPAAQAEKGEEHYWSDHDENALYEDTLAQVLKEKEGKAWAAGNLRIGSVLLLIDSDTRVPEDCFADAVSEMAESPEVAIIQHASGVMQVAHHFFENGVAHFTRGIQLAISYCCASGEVAPFVGHNAFLRWSALQECMFVDPDDGIEKIWSEDHVSEDFQLALMLQMKGYTVRWAGYTNGEFEEGVSLTCDDELNRWQKYAYGCSELVFHPLKTWWKRGPVTPLFRQFLWSSIPLHSKISISAYIFSYYAISCAWFLTTMNYFIKGWNLPIDGYYLPSWNITIVCLVLFGGISNVAFITLRYRLKTPDAAEMSMRQLKWIPFFLIFFSGMSMPMSYALVSHLVGYNMTWSSTVKTVQKSNFFLQVPLIWKRFYPQLVFFGVMLIGMAIMATLQAIPPGWRIYSIEVIVPLSLIGAAHVLYPFALNPWFLSFSF